MAFSFCSDSSMQKIGHHHLVEVEGDNLKIDGKGPGCEILNKVKFNSGPSYQVPPRGSAEWVRLSGWGRDHYSDASVCKALLITKHDR